MCGMALRRRGGGAVRLPGQSSSSARGPVASLCACGTQIGSEQSSFQERGGGGGQTLGVLADVSKGTLGTGLTTDFTGNGPVKTLWGGCIGRRGGTPRPLTAAQPMPSCCPPDGKCQLQWHS